MKNYNAEKISLTNFLHYQPASDNFAGGYTESLACSQFLVYCQFYIYRFTKKKR